MKNIILDLGGVLFDLDYGLTGKEFEKLGLSDAFSKAKQLSVFDELEEGKISQQEFITAINQLCSKKHSTNTIIEAWNKMLIGFPKERLELLLKLNKKYRLFLYSNTNAIHIKKVWEIIAHEHSIPNLDHYFEKVYLSNELGIRKPKTDGFEVICIQNKLDKNDTLFIDDSPQHIVGAKESGIHAEWLDLEKENIHQLLLRLKLI